MRLALPGMALVGVCYGLARFAYGLFVPDLRDEFGLDASLLGGIGAGSYVGYCLAIVISFLATDRLGPRPVAIAAGVLASTGTALVAAATHPLALAIGLLIAGTSTGVASPPLAAAVARWVARRRRDRVQTVVNAGTGVGVLLSGPVALAAASLGQWRLAWAGFAVVAAAVTGWVAVAVPRGGGVGGARATGSVHVPSGTTTMVVAATVMGAASAAVWVFGADMMVTHGGMTRTAGAWWWILLGVAGLVGALAGDVIARVGLRAAWLLALVVLAAAVGVVGLLPQVWPLAFAAGAAFGAAYIALTGMLLVWGTRVYGHRPATGVGVAFLAIAVGQIVGSILIGALADATSPAFAFACFALLTLLGALVRPGKEIDQDRASMRSRASRA